MKIILNIIIISFIIIMILSCKRDKNPVDYQNELTLPITESTSHYNKKVVNGQICHIYYSDTSSDKTEWEPAPLWIVGRADNFIIKNFGDSIFNTSISLRSYKLIPVEARSDLYNEKFDITYNFNISISDFSTNCVLAVYLDSLGNVINYDGIVDLKSKSDSKGLFNMTDIMAVNTAQQYGLESGLYPWQVRFYYFRNNINKYVWSISNFSSKYNGINLIIDSDKPEVIYDLSWAAVDIGGW